jgi:hypothetical protein
MLKQSGPSLLREGRAGSLAFQMSFLSPAPREHQGERGWCRTGTTTEDAIMANNQDNKGESDNRKSKSGQQGSKIPLGSRNRPVARRARSRAQVPLKAERRNSTRRPDSKVTKTNDFLKSFLPANLFGGPYSNIIPAQEFDDNFLGYYYFASSASAACSDQSKQQRNSTRSTEPNPQVDVDESPDTPRVVIHNPSLAETRINLPVLSPFSSAIVAAAQFAIVRWSRMTLAIWRRVPSSNIAEAF